MNIVIHTYLSKVKSILIYNLYNYEINFYMVHMLLPNNQ